MQHRDPLQADPTLANRFLAHQLSDAERESFEVDLQANPDLVRDLEATARFKVGLQKLREMGELDALLKPRSQSRRAWLFATAAALVVGTGIALWKPATPPSLLAASIGQLSRNEGLTLASTKTYAMFRKRATEDRVIIELPAAREAIKLRILPRTGTRPPYRVSVTATSNLSVVIGSVVVDATDGDGFLTVFADSGRLDAESYLLIVAETAQDESSGDSYLIEATRTAPYR